MTDFKWCIQNNEYLPKDNWIFWKSLSAFDCLNHVVKLVFLFYFIISNLDPLYLPVHSNKRLIVRLVENCIKNQVLTSSTSAILSITYDHVEVVNIKHAPHKSNLYNSNVIKVTFIKNRPSHHHLHHQHKLFHYNQHLQRGKGSDRLLSTVNKFF